MPAVKFYAHRDLKQIIRFLDGHYLFRLRVAVWIAAVVLCALILNTTARAEEQDRGRWWLTPSIQQQLELTPTEVEMLDSAYDVTYSRMIELRGDKKAAEIQLENLLKAPDFDKGAILQVYNNLQTSRNALMDQRFAFFLETRKIIGHDRFVQLLEIKKAHRHHHRERNPSPTPVQ
jgi:hypothetical protein